MRLEIKPWMVLTLTAVVVVNLVLTAVIGFLANHASTLADSNTISIEQLQAEFLASQAKNGAFEIFLKGFTAEINYECNVLWAINRSNANVPPPPPAAICNVKAP